MPRHTYITATGFEHKPRYAFLCLEGWCNGVGFHCSLKRSTKLVFPVALSVCRNQALVGLHLACILG